ncbi:hypothetical protein [Microseira sp. BLCC-F43]|jgi:hypothetical protein|uniref:hypothetical protein n=1 Tax=Microseira sp. BLCC-F43 TaxID=3153602 RepID=UPI0035BA6018
MQLIELLGSKIETLLLVLVIILQILLIFLVLQRQPQLVPEGLVVRRKSQLSKETVEKESPRSDNLWDNPPPATKQMKLTIAEFKDKYNRSDLWDGIARSG